MDRTDNSKNQSNSNNQTHPSSSGAGVDSVIPGSGLGESGLFTLGQKRKRRTAGGQNSRTRIFWPGSKKVTVKDSLEASVDIQFLRSVPELVQQDRNSELVGQLVSACHHREGSSSLQVFSPGQLIQCQYSMKNYDLLQGEDRVVNSVENSILWQTEGKGDSDIGIHFFQRRTPKTENVKDPKSFFSAYQFRTVCPNSPLSYDGQLLSINWLVRVRFFMKNGQCITADRPFKVCLK